MVHNLNVYLDFCLTGNTIELNLYNKIDFNNKPEEYCGMYITDSII